MSTNMQPSTKRSTTYLPEHGRTLAWVLAAPEFVNRLGEIRDRSFEQQHYRASGLNLLTAAIVLWNTVYLDRTVATLTSDGGDIDPDLLRFLSPLGWEHINLTGDYTWPRANHIKPGKYRPLRRSAKP